MVRKTAKHLKIKFRYRHPVWFTILITTMILCLAIGAAGSLYIKKTIDQTPNVPLSALRSDASSNMYSANNQLIWSSSKNKRIYVSEKDIPVTYKHLLLDTEDASFYQDAGFSPKGLINAGLSYLKSKLGRGEARGGSSIEQQLIKLSVFSVDAKDRTISRKVKEFFLANQLYQNYSKDKILEFYINKISMGEGAYGAQTIAKTYFNKDLKDLTISQQAIIAGLGQAPSYYNLYDQPEAVKNRRNMVLSTAYKHKHLTKQEYMTAKNTDVKDGLQPRHWLNSAANAQTLKYDAFVQSSLKQVSDLGYDLDNTPLQIYTTLDTELQDKLNTIVNTPQYFQSPSMQIALTSVDPKTGHVLAQIGGRNLKSAYGLNRATNTHRSTGSGTKPLIEYAPAIEYLNWATNHPIDTSAYTYPGTNITATNYGGNRGVGVVDIQTALRQSYNTSAIRVLDAVGSTNANTFLKDNGISLKKAPAASDALGINASSAEVATGFATFANGGIYNQTQYLTKLVFTDNSVRKIKPKSKRAMRKSTAYLTTQMLKGVFSEYGTAGKNSSIKGVAMAGKTGTVAYDNSANVPSMAASDVWTNAYTKGVAISMWIGYDKPLAPYSYVTQSYALNTKNALFKKIMQTATSNRDNSDWKAPSTVAKINGSGLKSQYKPLDKPQDKALQEPSVATSHSNKYKLLRSNSKKKLKLKTESKAFEKIPKKYQIGAWQEDFNQEKADYENSAAHQQATQPSAGIGADLQAKIDSLTQQIKEVANNGN